MRCARHSVDPHSFPTRRSSDLPANEGTGFAAAARAITRIAKEGRKYGISLGLISQRPTELSQAALSQCGTIFRSEEHTSELQSRRDLVCRLLLEKKKRMFTRSV